MDEIVDLLSKAGLNGSPSLLPPSLSLSLSLSPFLSPFLTQSKRREGGQPLSQALQGKSLKVRWVMEK